MDKFKISLIVNVILLGFVVMLFMNKGNIKDQALEHIAKAQKQNAQLAEHFQNRLALFAIADSIYKMPDTVSRTAIKAYAEAQKLPRCGLEACKEGDEKAKISTSLSNTPGASNITISGGGYVVVVNFTDQTAKKKGVFKSINVNSLLGKPVNGDAESEESEESAE